MHQLTTALTRVAALWPPEQFEEGDCHTLAMAIHQAMASSTVASDRQGTLCACMSMSVEEDGTVYSIGYSHMVYEAPDGSLWDIGGPEADIRWEEQFDTESTDKWGMRTELEWVPVPCQHPDYADTYLWLQAHDGNIDVALQDQLAAVIRQHLAQPVAA